MDKYKMDWSKLLSAKWLISILTTIVFCYLAIVERVTAEMFITIYTFIAGAYFGQSVARKQG